MIQTLWLFEIKHLFVILQSEFLICKRAMTFRLKFRRKEFLVFKVSLLVPFKSRPFTNSLILCQDIAPEHSSVISPRNHHSPLSRHLPFTTYDKSYTHQDSTCSKNTLLLTCNRSFGDLSSRIISNAFPFTGFSISQDGVFAYGIRLPSNRASVGSSFSIGFLGW